MSFEDVNNFVCCNVAENMLIHVGNMIDDVESFVDGDDVKKLREARKLVGLVLRNVWEKKHEVLDEVMKEMEAKE